MQAVDDAVSTERTWVQRILTPRRLRLYSFSILLGAAIGFGVFVGTSHGLRTLGGGRMGGDFPSFYGAAVIVHGGNATQLYSESVQRDAQAPFLPDIDGWLQFSYPPYVALAYVPFTFVSFKTAFLLHTALMVTCTIVALVLLRSVLPNLREHFAPIVAATLTFYPVFRANVGGQNTGLSLLCAAGIAAALARRRHITAGVWLGAWMFKPQLALAAAVPILIAYPRAIVGFVLAAGFWYAVGAALGGVLWPAWWIRQGVLPFAPVDLFFDRANAVSFPKMTAAIGMPALGLLLVVVTAGLVLPAAFRKKKEHPSFAGMASAAAVLVSPHALYYDGGVAAIAFATAGDVLGSALVGPAVLCWLLGALQPLRPYLPVPPLTLVLIVALMYARKAASGNGSRPAAV